MNALNYAAYGVKMPSSDVGSAYIQGQQSRALEQRIGNQNKLAQATVANAETAQQEAARKEIMQKLGLMAGALYDVKSPEDYQRAEDNLVSLGVLTREDAAKYNYGMLPQIVGSVRDYEDRIQDDRDRSEFDESVRQFNLKFARDVGKPADEYARYVQEETSAGRQPLSRIDYAQAKKGKGVTITNSDGSTVQIGGGGGDISRRTQGDIENKEFEARDSLARLDTIQTNLNNPDFMESLTAAGRLKQWGLEWADTLDPSLLSPEQQEYLSSVATARGDILENVNFTIKAITGAAMTEPEAKRIGGTLPGINDSPTVFKAKLKRSLDRTRAAVARYHLWSQGGGRGSPESYDTLGNVEKKMMDRAAELKKAVESGEMDATAASAQFRLEFGT